MLVLMKHNFKPSVIETLLSSHFLEVDSETSSLWLYAGKTSSLPLLTEKTESYQFSSVANSSDGLIFGKRRPKDGRFF